MSVTTKRYGWLDNKEFYRRVIFLKGFYHYGKIPKSRSRDCCIIAGNPDKSGGLTVNAALYPAPPVAVLDLTAAKNAYVTALNGAIAPTAMR